MDHIPNKLKLAHLSKYLITRQVTFLIEELYSVNVSEQARLILRT